MKKPPRSRTPKLARAGTAESWTNVLLEEMRARKAVSEAAATFCEEFK